MPCGPSQLHATDATSAAGVLRFMDFYEQCSICQYARYIYISMDIIHGQWMLSMVKLFHKLIIDWISMKIIDRYWKLRIVMLKDGECWLQERRAHPEGQLIHIFLGVWPGSPHGPPIMLETWYKTLDCNVQVGKHQQMHSCWNYCIVLSSLHPCLYCF